MSDHAMERRTRKFAESGDKVESAQPTRVDPAASDPASLGHDALVKSLNQSPRAQLLLQLQRALNRSPRVQTQLALQRTLNQGLQQMQGRVKPTLQAKGVAINDDAELEREADAMGAQALQMPPADDLSQAAQMNAGARMPPTSPVYQPVAAGAVLQLIYLWDRSKKEDKPHWVDKQQPPEGYLHSGRYDDKIHGDDDLYARLGGTDLYYGVSYEEDPRLTAFLEAIEKIGKEEAIKNIGTPEGFAAALRIYEADIGKPLIEVEAMKALYGGSSGWDTYTLYLQSGKEAGTATLLKTLNPGLPWANVPAGRACQVAMIEAIRRDGSVRFLLDGIEDVKGVVEGTSEWSGHVTSHELRFALALLGRTINVGNDRQVIPRDGVNVFFYLNRKLVPAAKVKWLGMDKDALAHAMAMKLAEEEEWDEEDEKDVLELESALAKGMTEDQLIEALNLP